jgi:hypothetical protein
VFGILGNAGHVIGRAIRCEHWLACPNHLGARAVDRRNRRIFPKAFRNRLLLRVGDDAIDAREASFFANHVDDAAVREVGDGEPGKRAERRLVVERGRKHAARVCEKPLFLLDAAPLGDVHEYADRATYAALLVEEGHRPLVEAHAASVWMDDIQFHVQDFDAVRCRVLHRQLLRRDLAAVLEHLEWRPFAFGRTERCVLRRADAQLFGERPVDPNLPTLRVFGNADADRQDVEDRIELARPSTQVRAQARDQVEHCGVQWPGGHGGEHRVPRTGFYHCPVGWEGFRRGEAPGLD